MNTSTINVCIVVLNWNGIKDTINCIESLLQQTYKHFSILVVDNGSIDNSFKQLEIIAKKEPRVKVIGNPKNLGFAGGVNTGIRYAIEQNYDAVALFNNDAVADKNWLRELVKALTPDRSIVTGLLLNKDGTKIDTTGEGYSIWGLPFSTRRGEKTEDHPDSSFVFGATGGASLYRTALFKEIGLFDETFFVYYEDVDISFRAQLAGHKVYFTNTAIAYHQQGATSKRIPGLTIYHTFKNVPALFFKNVPLGLILPVGLRLFVLFKLILGNAIKNGNGGPALKGAFASIGYFWTRHLWQRFYIQSKRKVPTSYIRSIILYDLPPDQKGMRKFRKFFTGKD